MHIEHSLVSNAHKIAGGLLPLGFFYAFAQTNTKLRPVERNLVLVDCK